MLKTLHGWIGVLLLPWIVLVGVTGLYMNHARAVSDFLSPAAYDESQFESWPSAAPVTQGDARRLAYKIYPEAEFEEGKSSKYHDRPVWKFKSGSDQVLVERNTGHYWVKTWFTRETFSPDGQLLHSKRYWGSVMDRIHNYGWIDSTFGRWITDIVAGCFVLFALSGVTLFLMPRLRRRRNRRARLRAASASTISASK
ncbi:PepSY-associated TM helix domain-containing protein [Aliiroseovarius sp. KMU-71]|nr:PepSY-associated TM helix domain-containing protein [Aliiroseovarius sp. S1123]